MPESLSRIARLADPVRRRELRASVAHLGRAIADGELDPQRVELEALAQLCDEAALPDVAARVRRWIEWMRGA